MRYTLRDLVTSVLVLFILAGGVFVANQKSPAFVSQATSQETPVVLPTPVPYVSDLQGVHAPDGAVKLVLKTTLLQDRQTGYTLTVSDVSGANRQMVYEGSLPDGSKITLPPNSWSPDNKLFFIKQQSPDRLAVLVFQANGTAFADGADYIDVSSIFREKLPDAILRDVTGWDDPALLHVMTYNADKTIGLSYWFDIGSRSFIQLAHR